MTPNFRTIFAQEFRERGHVLLVAVEILGDALVKMRGAVVEFVRGRVLADETGDLVHLGDPAVGLRRHQRQAALEPGEHLLLAGAEFREQRVGGAGPRRRQHHRGADRLRPLGDAGIGHFQRRGRAQRAVEHAHVEAVSAQRRQSAAHRGRRRKSAAGVTSLRRRADDAGIDERATGRRDHGGDPFDRRRIDGVALDEDRLAVAGLEGRRETLGKRHRVAGRQDREDEIGRRDFLVARRREAVLLRPRGGLGAAAGQGGKHLQAILDQPPPTAAPIMPGAITATTGFMSASL